MTRAIDTSLTFVAAGRNEPVDVHVFADPHRHLVIRSASVAAAFRTVASAEAPIRRMKVGVAPSSEDVDFFVLDLKRDKTLHREITRVIDEAFLDAVTGALKSAVGRQDGLLHADATLPLDMVGDIVELRRFIVNAAAHKGRKMDLLFHHASAEAAE